MPAIPAIRAVVFFAVLGGGSLAARGEEEAPRPAAGPAAERTFGADAGGLLLAVSEDGGRLAAVSGAGRFVVWDVASAKPLATGETGANPSRIELVDGGRKLVAEVGRYLRDAVRVAVFDSATGKQVHEWKSRSDDPVSPFGTVSLAGVLPAKGEVALSWRERTGHSAPQFHSASTFEPVSAGALPAGIGRFEATRDGGHIACAGGVAERSTGRWVWTLANADAFAGRQDVRISKGEGVTLEGLAEGASAVLFRTVSPQGLVTCAYGLADGKPLWLLAEGEVEATASGAPHVVVARGRAPGRYELVDGRTGKAVRQLAEFGERSAAAMSPDGAWVYALTDDQGTIRAIPASGAAPGAEASTTPPGGAPSAPVRTPLPPARNVGSQVTAFALAPDGSRLAVAGLKHVVVWAPDSAKPLHELPTGGVLVHRLAFSADGREIYAGLSGSHDVRPQILRWDVATGVKRTGIPSRDVPARKERDRFDRDRPGDVTLIGTAGASGGVLVRFLDVGHVVLDPDSGRPLHPDALVPGVHGVSVPDSHLPEGANALALDPSGEVATVSDFDSIRLVRWSRSEVLAELTRDEFKDLAGDLYVHRMAFLGGDRVVCEGFTGSGRDREAVVARLDFAPAGMPWKLKDAGLLDASGGDRPEVLVRTKNGVELIDARTGKFLRRVVSASESPEFARFIPGTRRAWIVSAKGAVKAVNLPE